MILEQSKELQVGAFVSEGRYVSYFGGKMAISVGIPTRRTCASLCRFDLSRKTVATVSLSPSSLSLFLGRFYSFPPPMACTTLRWRSPWCSPYPSLRREAVWMNICSLFSLHYKFSVVGKGAKCNGKASTEKCPYFRRGVLLWGGAIDSLSLHWAHFFFLYNCITANDKWRMFDSWLRCLTATVLARGPWQALDFCSKWVKHIRHYEGTEAWRTRAEMSDLGRLLGTQLAK